MTAGALLVFAADKGAQPSSPAVYYILGGVLACAGAVWLTLLPLGQLKERADRLQEERDLAVGKRDTLRGERDALRGTNETVRTERDQTRGELRHLAEQTEVAGRPRLPDVITNRVIELGDLPRWVTEITFEGCELVGPGPALVTSSVIDACKLLGLEETPFLVVDDISQLPEGTVRFFRCKFVRCKFQAFAFVGNGEQMANLRAAFQVIR